MPDLRMILLISAAAVSVSCQAGAPRPVEIVLNEESCSQCRMAISQRQFAAEVVFADGRTEFFDDIGCMVHWVRAQKPDRAGIFVVDSTGGEWLACSAAFYVRSAGFHSPMSYGILAFKNSENAETAAGENEGILLSWEQLLEEDFF